eukprot:CAMPEP_0182502722 /NCGR_PEP_ID=MMETSP1321-20130603/13970_1 /TAXON_ID=91990 /ORGANISM="Bolidomonas sp., Strain RCC1657" /LENGTH=485 /DNA_ID=CAMNT_0024707717 /DNA_START=77 /DNA_END=1531 /DNA_ORIENTATION=+
MGNCSSAPATKEVSLQKTPDTKRDLEDVEVEVGGDEEEEEEPFEDEGDSSFDLTTIDLMNPSLQGFNGSSAVQWLKDTFDGTQLKVSLTAPIEMVVRCFMNRCIKLTKGTDLGDWIKQIAQADMKKLLDGVRTLQQKELLTASDQLVSLIKQIEFILDVDSDNEKDRLELIENFKVQANTCLENAQVAFNAVGPDSVDEQIRSVQISVSVLIATECYNRSSTLKKSLRSKVEQEVVKLLKLDRIQNDAKHQLDPEHSGRTLDYKKAREARIRAVLMVVMHAESFAATNGLEAIIPKKKARLSFSSKAADIYPVSALLRSGVFEGKATAKQLKELGEQFSDKELSVIAGFLDEAADDLGLIAAEKQVEEPAVQKVKEEKKAEKPAPKTSSAVEPSEETKQLEAAVAEAKKKKDLPLMKSLKAELAVSKKADADIFAATVKVNELKQKVEDAWETENDELIEKMQGLLEKAEAEFAPLQRVMKERER